MLRMSTVTSWTCLLHVLSFTLIVDGQSASLMQVKTARGTTTVPLKHATKSSRRRTKAAFQNVPKHTSGSKSTLSLSDLTSPQLNSTRPEVSSVPLMPVLAQVESVNSTALLQNDFKSERRKYMFVRGVFFVLLSSAFVLTAWRAFTMERKSHVLAVGVMVVILWFTVGATAFMGEVLPITKHKEGLTIIETAYLCVQILTTVGYGDLTPSSPCGRLFVCAYCLSALVMVAALISELADYLAKMSSRDLAEGLIVVQQRIDLVHGSVPVEGIELQSTPHRRLLRSVLYFSVLVLAGTLFYGLYPGEKKTLEEALYMSIVTLSTIGFGDQVAKTEGGRAFACIWMLIGVSAMAKMVSEFAETFLRIRQAWTTEDVTHSLLKEMDADGDGKVDKAEFMHFTLLHYGLVSKEDLDAIMKQFDSLDRDQSGFLDSKDLELFK